MPGRRPRLNGSVVIAAAVVAGAAAAAIAVVAAAAAAIAGTSFAGCLGPAAVVTLAAAALIGIAFAGSLILISMPGLIRSAFAILADISKTLQGLARATFHRRSLPAHPAAHCPGSPSGAAGIAMRVAAHLMPRAAGQRWLAEADSFLFEASPDLRAAAIRDYLATAPQAIAACWASEAIRRARRTAGAGSGQAGGEHGHR
jgi:hypothetical protein